MSITSNTSVPSDDPRNEIVGGSRGFINAFAFQHIKELQGSYRAAVERELGFPAGSVFVPLSVRLGIGYHFESRLRELPIQFVGATVSAIRRYAENERDGTVTIPSGNKLPVEQTLGLREFFDFYYLWGFVDQVICENNLYNNYVKVAVSK